MTPLEIADTCARAIADPGSFVTPPTKMPTFYSGCEAPRDQVCAAVWLPWDWADLPDQELFFGYLWPTCQRMLEGVPASREPSPDGLHLPEGVDAALAVFETVSVRAVIMEHPVPPTALGLDLSPRRKPWYNTMEDAMEQRDVVPLLRLDMRLQLKQGASP